jgi:hypothetical protein
MSVVTNKIIGSKAIIDLRPSTQNIYKFSKTFLKKEYLTERKKNFTFFCIIALIFTVKSG